MLKNNTYYFVIVYVFLFIFCYQVKAQDQILGKWKPLQEEGKQCYFVKEANGMYTGKVINDTENTANNGKIFLSKLVFDKEENIYRGNLHVPDKNITLNMVATIEQPNQLKIVAKKFFISKTFLFERIQ